MNRLQKHLGKIIFISTIVLFFSYIGYRLYHIPATSLEEKFLLLMKEDGYIILFAWSILEGEMGLIMAGVLSHMGDMSLEIAIFIAGLGGFAIRYIFILADTTKIMFILVLKTKEDILLVPIYS